LKQTTLTENIDEVIKIKIEVANEYIEEIIEPLMEFGNPEKLMKKPYEQWTPQDLMVLARIYGNDPDSPLSKLIFRKEYEKVKQLERG
jgi:hypothetical protein